MVEWNFAFQNFIRLSIHFSRNYICTPESYCLLVTLDRDKIEQYSLCHFNGEILPFLKIYSAQYVKNRLKPGFGQMDYISLLPVKSMKNFIKNGVAKRPNVGLPISKTKRPNVGLPISKPKRPNVSCEISC